ncbi:YicC family protein [bacterium]|nr:YicC family protein [candidate division CSSED10-310 bacterium]
MVLSMTGFGESQTLSSMGTLHISIRSVNHKYLSLNIKMPHGLMMLEPMIRDQVKHRISRGRVDIALGIDGLSELPREVMISTAHLKSVVNALREAAGVIGLSGDLSLGDLLNIPGIFTEREETREIKELSQGVEIGLGTALDELQASREREGKAIARDLQTALVRLRELVAAVNEAAADYIPRCRERLEEALQRVASGLQLEPGRLEQEVAMLVERADITEELNRARTHLIEFERLLGTDGTIGKKLDFIAQELMREISTMGAKLGNARGSLLVIDCKSELEVIREQLQNVE